MSENQQNNGILSCQALWDLVTSLGQDERTTDSDSMSCGFRGMSASNEIRTWTLEHGGYTIRATSFLVKTKTPLLDKCTATLRLSIHCGEEAIFSASKKEGGTLKKFDAHGIPSSSEELPSEMWRVAEGVIPPELANAVA